MKTNQQLFVSVNKSISPNSHRVAYKASREL